VVALLAMLVPLTLFFAAAQLSLSFFAGSFKEAQSTISPMLIVVIVLAAIGLMPGVVSLNVGTALVPVLNVSLATKEVIAGTASVGLLALVYASLLVLAGASLVVAARLFRRETIIFRS
jgi:sodium transport system permease protein